MQEVKLPAVEGQAYRILRQTSYSFNLMTLFQISFKICFVEIPELFIQPYNFNVYLFYDAFYMRLTVKKN